MATRMKIEDDHRVIIPDELLRALNIDVGDHLLWEIRDGVVTMIAEPKDHVGELRGLHKGIWEGIEIEEYINAERDSWDE